MRGPYSNYAAPPVYYYTAPSKKGLQFSRTEIAQLAVAVVALSLALTVLFIRDYYGYFAASPTTFFTIFFVASLVAVGTGIALHEIMHKAVAQRYGHWAEFRFYPFGLVLAFVFAFMGFIYGAPGATYISGNVTRDQNGKISAAGPATNLVLAVVFLGIETFVLNLGPGLVETLVLFIVLQAAFMNLVLAGFNMLPVMPLDGAKVWQWNKGVYAGIVSAVVVIFVGAYYARLISF